MAELLWTATNPEQAKIAEDAGLWAVMALEQVLVDMLKRAFGGVLYV